MPRIMELGGPGFRRLAQEHPVVSDVVDVIGKRHPRCSDRQHERTQQDQSVARGESAMTAKHELAAGEELFDFVRIPRQARRKNLRTVIRHLNDVFDPDANTLLRYVEAWFDGDHHIGGQRERGVIRIVYIQPHMMADAVSEILSQRFAVFVLAMRIEVVTSHLVQTCGAHAAEETCRA